MGRIDLNNLHFLIFENNFVEDNKMRVRLM
jgi:hypothetical protein